MNGLDLTILRLKANLRQYELAQLLGVPSTVVCDWERGRRQITLDIEQRIKEAIGKHEANTHRKGHKARVGEHSK